MAAVIPLLYNGSARIGLLAFGRETLPLHVRPFNSEVHSASALLPCFHHPGLKTMPARLSGNRFEAYSSSSAFLDTIGRYSMTEEGECQEEN